MMKVFGLLDGLDDPFFNKQVTVVSVPDTEILKDTTNNGGTITAIDATAKTITRSTSEFLEGTILYITTFSGGSIIKQWVARVTETAATATYVILSGSDGTLGTQSCSVILYAPYGENHVDIGDLYVHRITKLWDVDPDGRDRTLDQVFDGKMFTELGNDPFMDDRVAFYHNGDRLNFFVGESADVINAPLILEYRKKPTPYVYGGTDSNEVGLPPEHNQMLIDEIVSQYMTLSGRPINPELQGRLQEYSAKFAADQISTGKEAKK